MLGGIRDRLARMTRGISARGPAPASTPRVVLLLGTLVTFFFFVLTAFPPSPFKALEYIGYDEMVQRLRGPLSPPEVAVVDVDERSLARLGQWPWPRYRIAALVENAAALGARSIAIDFLFPEPDRISLREVSELYRRDRGVDLSLTGIPDGVLDNDQILADTIAKHKVVLGADLRFEDAPAGANRLCGRPLSVVLRALPGTEGAPPVPEAFGMVCPIPALVDAASFVAAANRLPDRDGKVRRTPLLVRLGEQWAPSLVVGALLAATGENQVIVQWSNAGVLDVRIGQTTIPTDHQGNLLLPYRARPTDRFEHISAVDLLEGRVEAGRLQGKIVFLGSSASGLQDLHATPVMSACPGVDLHALATDAVLRKDFFVEPAWNQGVQAIVVVLAGFLVTYLVARARVTVSALATAAAVATVIFGTWSVFNRWGIYWSPIPGMSILLVNSSLLTLVRLRREEKRKELLRQSFERYVSAQIVDQILRSSQPVNVSGERRAVTILMSDIRGFTSMSERMAPEDLVQFLNSYFAAMIDIILANEGTLDKFMGDAVLALFGAPICHDDDPLRAVKVALAMQDKLRDLNAHWADQGKPKIRVGIGISTGEVIVGNIGSSRRLEYTAIGQYVNYAQRIEDLTKSLPCDILISDTTYERVKDYVQAERFGPLTIRGREAAIYVYGVKGLANRS